MNKINKDWKEVKLGDIVDITMGQSPKSEFYNKRNEGMPFLQGSATFGFMHPYFETYSSDIKKIAINGSVLMSVRAPVGDLNIANADVCIGRGLCSINGKSNIINRYIFYLLSYYKPKLLNMQKGTTFGAITKDDILNFKVLIAEYIDEQKRIASALSKIDAYLENTIKLIEEKERFKRGIAKKLLTCKEGENIPEARFKGFNDDWRKEKLSSMIKIQGGYAFKSSEFKKSGIPIIRISNISNTDNNMNMKEVVYYNEIENEKSFIIKKSDLLIALSGAPGKSSIYNLEEKAYLNQRVGLFKIIDTKKINNSFLSQYVFSSIFQNKLKHFITRGVQPNISPKDIENLDILLPSLKEQEKIGGYLSLLDKEIDNLKKQKELIKEMKRGAMQKLLSGEVRLLE